MKECDYRLLLDGCKSESAFYNHIRLRVSIQVWTFIQTVPSLNDSMLKKISSGMLQAEVRFIEVINKHGFPSLIPDYWLYELVL